MCFYTYVDPAAFTYGQQEALELVSRLFTKSNLIFDRNIPLINLRWCPLKRAWKAMVRLQAGSNDTKMCLNTAQVFFVHTEASVLLSRRICF